jgi:hypothetical protein
MSGSDDQESRDTMLEEVMPQNHMMYCWTSMSSLYKLHGLRGKEPN